MSLITDNDYFLQALRLAFLRVEAPLGSHATQPTALITSAPSYALSQYALQAGLHPQATSDFTALSRSPGAIPLTSSGKASRSYANAEDSFTSVNNTSAVDPDRPPRSRRRRPTDGERREESKTNEVEPGVEDAASLPGASGLLHTETIVGRRGSAGPERPSKGLLAGMRTRGRHSKWRPKPEHLNGEDKALDYSLDRNINRSGGSDRHLSTESRPAVLVDLPARTALVGRDDIEDTIPRARKSHTESRECEDSSDNRPRADSEASLTTSESAYDHMPPLDRALAQHFGSQPASPVSHLHAEPFETASRRVSVTTDGVTRQINKRSKSPFELLGNMSDARGVVGGADTHRSPTASLRRRRERTDTAASSEAGLGDDESDNDEPHQQHRNEIYGSIGKRDRQARTAEIDHDEAEDVEEDPFEFSLQTRELSATSSFENGALPTTSPHPIEATAPSMQEQSTLVSPPRRLYLHSIQENGVDATEIVPITGEMAGSFDADALRAMQSARRRSRRRVNIPGRQISETAESSSISPELRRPAGLRSNTGNPAHRPQSAEDVLSDCRDTGQAVRSPLPGPQSPAFANASPTTSSSSPWTTSLVVQAVRPEASLRSRRQRSHTDPSLNISTASVTSPVTSPSRGPKSSLRRTLAMSTINSQRQTVAASSPQAASALVPHDQMDEDGYATEPLKPLPARLYSESLATAGQRARSSSAAGDFLIPSQPSVATQDRKVLHVGSQSHDALQRSASPRLKASKYKDPYLMFPIHRQEVPLLSASQQQSALTAMLRSADIPDDSSSSNPFNEFYGALFAKSHAAEAGRFGSRHVGPAPITVYFPNSNKPSLPIKIHVKSDLVIEEIIGCALWKYWAESRKPSLCPGSNGENDIHWDDRPAEHRSLLSTSSWILKIADADEDGEIDDDFPAPERTRRAHGFGLCYALLQASATQAKANTAADAHIQRRQSRIIKRLSTRSPADGAVNSLTLPPPNGDASMSMSASIAADTPTKVAYAAASADLVYVRVRIPLKGVEAIVTTVHVPIDMYLADVLELVCRKKNLNNPKEWCLMIADRGLVVPLDRTVESLQGAYQLALAKKPSLSALQASGAGASRAGQLVNTNPSASVFKRLSEPPQPRYVSAADLDTNYRSYVVQRKMPMPLGRHERLLTIDNDYIHIMPSEANNVTGTVRTASYHVSQIASCKVSKRTPSSFKLIVWRTTGKDVKRYDFEATNHRMAAEIAETVTSLVQAWKEMAVPEL